MGNSLSRGRTLDPRAVGKARQWREQRVAVLQERFDANPMSLSFKERHELKGLGGRATVKEEKKPKVPAPPKAHEEPGKPPPPSATKEVSHSVRHARAVLRRISSSLEIKGRRKKQKKSHGDLEKSVIKSASGGRSPRPNRHANKRKKVEKYADAK